MKDPLKPKRKYLPPSIELSIVEMENGIALSSASITNDPGRTNSNPWITDPDLETTKVEWRLGDD